MSRRLAIAALAGMLGATAGAALAAEVELGLVTGAQQTGGVATSEGGLDLEGGILYGLTVGWRVRPDGIVEVAWSRQESEASGDLDSGPAAFDVDIDTFEIGGLWETRPGKLRPFLGLALGATRVAGPDQDFDEGWSFSGSIGGGVRYDLSERALLRLEGRASGFFLAEGGALACGVSGGGACALSLSGSLVGAVSARVGIAARF
jgi:hypothetical protein